MWPQWLDYMIRYISGERSVLLLVRGYILASRLAELESVGSE